MRETPLISALFAIAALYDGLLGIVFVFAAGPVFDWFQVAPPNHIGYVQFPALLLIVFAIMFAAIARQPALNRDLIPYGIMLKLSYAGTVLFYWIAADLPFMWKPFAIADLAFAALFVWAYVALKEWAIPR